MVVPELEALKNKLRGLPDAIPGLFKASFENLKPLVEDVVIGQLQQGQRGDGSFLPFYSPVSVNVFGKRPGPMTLEDTGNFYRGLTLLVHNDGIEMTGTDMKTDMLQLRYGDDIIDIQEKNLEYIEKNYLEEELGNQIHEHVTQ